MIAALVFIALAAGAQVQGFPGSDPVAEALAVLPEQAELLGAHLGDNVMCLIKYLGKVQEVVKSGKEDLPLVEAALNTLVSNVKACGNQPLLPKLNCGLQAIRDSWENSEDIRKAALALGEQAAALAKQIKEDCFKSNSFLQTVY
ncbi:uncharacterized protein LOC117641848 [Thrips palmi]|uniref:Uncharacterized protein LOC117641848 n=1 Tax=Thrips palmi TaxID=161013 RepID=A0A6P8YEU8_THRPL|nr:uncharacterized protein LOC117641848 [Thrips palmi]